MEENILNILRVMVVDDQRSMRMIVRSLLNEEGISQVTEAGDGAEALQLIEGADNPPDVVICDLHMEGMDGLEFCQQVRMSKNKSIKDLRIIMLTGDKDRMMREISSQVGAVAVLHKPVSAEVLASEVAKAVDLDWHEECAKVTVHSAEHSTVH